MLVASRFNVTDGVITDCCIAFGGMAATPVRATSTEKQLREQSSSTVDIDQTIAEFAGSLQPISDVRASADYRQAAAQSLLRKTLYSIKGSPVVSVWEATA